MNDILCVSNLNILFKNSILNKDIYLVRDVGFTLKQGEILGIVGESGSGKSLTALSILDLLPYPKLFHDNNSSIKFKGQELLNNPQLNHIRGNNIGFVFQEPMSSLNPLHTIEHQISETIILHQGISPQQARKKTLRLLYKVGIKNPRNRLNSYPHELSGGQRQRVMIAMAIANRPDILIADEPTTALDVTVQQQIIELLLKLRQEMGMSLIFISHDLRLIKKIADNVLVMHQGKIVENGRTKDIFENPRHSYTKTLINKRNQLKNSINNGAVIVEGRDIVVKFPINKNFWGQAKQHLYAVNNLSFKLTQGRTLGIVGESGSGKTTLGNAVCNLINYQGEILLYNKSIKDYKNKELRKLIQIVFQDPYNSLNPRMTIEQIIGEGLHVHYSKLPASEKRDMIIQALRDVGLSDDVLRKYPHEFSGGQRQRIAIARALVVNPEVIIWDEPTSALDVTIQQQIIDLLIKLQEKHNLTYIFISHDINAVRAVADEIMVMKDGKIIEQGTTSEVFDNPKQEYTKQLIAASNY